MGLAGTLWPNRTRISCTAPKYCDTPTIRIRTMTIRRAIEAVLANPWAITDDGMELVASVASREHEYAGGNLEALEAKLGRPLNNTQRMTVRDGGVAMLPIQGPLFGKANMMTQLSGATSYDVLATDLNAALADPQVKSIVAVINSPGGQVDGASELSAMIKSARGKKPMVAFVEGQMCSAALWIGSAFDSITAVDTAQIGSLGVQMGMRQAAPKAGEKSYTFISSISPLKNASPDTEAGATAIKKVVDDLGMVFADAVAANRGQATDRVLENYGKGAVMVASDALARGMIDSIGTLEGVVSKLSKGANRMDYASLSASVLAEKRPDLIAEIGAQAVAKIEQPDAAAIRAEGAAAERVRIQSVREQAMPGHEALVDALAFDGKTTGPEAAVQILAAERGKVKSAAQAREADAPAVVPTAADADGSDAPVLNDRAKLDAAAKAYMSANPGTDYISAIKILQKGA